MGYILDFVDTLVALAAVLASSLEVVVVAVGNKIGSMMEHKTGYILDIVGKLVVERQLEFVVAVAVGSMIGYKKVHNLHCTLGIAGIVVAEGPVVGSK